MSNLYNRPTQEEVFGESLDGEDGASSVHSLKRDSTLEKMYVPASAIADSSTPHPLYVTPDQLRGGGIYVEKLSQLDAGDGVVNLGRQLDAVSVGGAGPAATGARIVGAVDFGVFLCGAYQRLKGVIYNERPVYRSVEPAGDNCPGFCMGHHLFLFYHKRNTAWVIGMKVNSGSGACAYVITPAALPMDVNCSETPWHVSMENGGFSRQTKMTCVKDASLEIPPPPGFRLPADGEDAPAGRHEAEEMLMNHRNKLPGAAGYYVLRESTSVPNAFVVSILMHDGDIEHIILTKTHDGAYTVTPEYTSGRALSFPAIADVVDHGYTAGFTIRQHTVRLGRCIHGEALAK
eukprot:m.78103 g.78103  ORF g.78103 m.78103 type:complete len:347 (+) comp9194_c0_seq1:157-1197(+)